MVAELVSRGANLAPVVPRFSERPYERCRLAVDKNSVQVGTADDLGGAPASTPGLLMAESLVEPAAGDVAVPAVESP